MKWINFLVVGSMFCLSVAVVAAQEPKNEEYWKGWCDGRRAGLELASRHINALLDDIRHYYVKEAAQEVVETIDHFRLVMPLTSFGAAVGIPFTAEFDNGLNVSCPDGRILRIPLEKQRG